MAEKFIFSIQFETPDFEILNRYKANLPSNYYCSDCTGFSIDSQLYLSGRFYSSTKFSIYEILNSSGAIRLSYETFSSSESQALSMKDYIFFQANVDFPKKWCDVGYRNESDKCIDIDECKIMRHYCDIRKRFK